MVHGIDCALVPSDVKVGIEALFENRDIGFLRAGQKAFIKFDAFPAKRFGIVNGRVSMVGADSREQVASKKWAYAARLVLDQTSLRVEGKDMALTPGMTATVDVITGERLIIGYFFDPVIKAVQDGLQER